MAKPLVVITRPLPGPATTILKRTCTLRQNRTDKVLSPKELRTFVAGATGIISLLTDHIDGAVMDAAGPGLKVVANFAVGFDNIDLEAAKKRDIIITNTPGVMNEAVAEHAIALMLACARRVVESDQFTRAGKYHHWEPEGFLGPQLGGKTLAVVGLGRIGSLVAEIAHRGFGMEILYHDIHRSPSFEKKLGAVYHELPVLLRLADVLSIHVPLLPSTRHLFGAQEFQMMKKSAILINTSRGPVVDEKALVHALKTKRIWAAGIDVFEHEPALTPGLVHLPNVVVTPHIASATIEAREAMSELAAHNILAVLSGKKPKNPVI